MGLLVEGSWHDRWYDTTKSGGAFVRTVSQFRNPICADGSTDFAPEANRYHLYVAMACPWAHRTLLFRTLKGLEGVISASTVHPDMLDQGWQFDTDTPDPLYESRFLHQLYTRAQPDYSGRVTVPVLWDKARHTIVNNESSEIIRFLDSAFSAVADPAAPLANTSMYPEPLRGQIDTINERVYQQVNNGVYKAGFATSQSAYDQAVTALFDALDWLEALLSRQRYLVGGRLTEADWRLFPTLVRFDAVYYSHFKCSRRPIREYPNLWAYVRELYQMPGVAETVDLPATRRHYFYSHATVNPHRIVPAAPHLDFLEPPGREHLRRDEEMHRCSDRTAM